MSKIAIPISILAMVSTAFGQVLTQPGSNGGATTPQPQPSGQPAPVPSSNNNSSEPLLGGELPFFDPGSETVMWDGKLWNVANNRIFAARFEKYLAAPEAITEEDEAYRKILDEIANELSPSRPGGPNLPGGVALLPEAAQFPIDAKLCDSMANAIWGVWLSQRNAASLNAANEAMRQRLKTLRWNFRIESESDLLKNDVRNNRPNGGAAPQQNGTAEQDASSMEKITGYLADATELQAKMTANKGEILISKTKAKVEFQALLVQLFLQRRFQHVVIGCRFYRNQFQDGDSTLHFEEGSDFGDTSLCC